MTALLSFLAWLLSAVATLLTTMAGPQAGPTQTIRRALHWSGSTPGGRTLEVSNIRGSIRVIGYDGPEVELVAYRTTQGDADAASLRREGELKVEERETSIRVCADGERCGCSGSDRRRGPWDDPGRDSVRVDFELRVPRTAALTVCTVTDGDVEVAGMSGRFDIRNVNGAVILSDMRGSGSAATVNGDVTAAFSEPPASDGSFKTINGDIVARFPADLSADLRLKTMHGGLFTDFDVAARPAPAAVAERQNGRFVYRSNSFATVRVGRGGPVLTFEGLNSRIQVLRVNR